MTSLLAFVFVLGVLVFVHELGHFLAARRIGVRVITFSLGFGPKLLSFTRGDTEYAISAIPLGGYVKMAGENPEDTQTGAPDEFMSKSKWERFQVLVMGPVMNLGLAWLVMAAVLYQGAQVPAFTRVSTVISKVTPKSAAEQAGLRSGDRIVAVDGTPVSNWEDFSMAVLPKAGLPVTVDVERDGQRTSHPMTVGSVGKFAMGDIGVAPVLYPQIFEINPGEPAQQAGLQPGDLVLSANEEPNPEQKRIIQLIQGHESQPLTLEVERAGRRVPITVHPKKTDGVVRIGAKIAGMPVDIIDPGPVEALKLSATQNWDWTKQIVKTLGGLFTRSTSVKQLMGPVAIGQLSGDAVERGWTELFGLMAMISLNLGLLNLMPVPVLDGGHIAILALEGVSRRDFSLKVKEKMLLVGFALLLTLMVTVIYNDLMRIAWIERLVPWR
ncbi:MAG TPA: RIP metalloprotease RseP [Aeromicrobium sp.]|nr:RIP metalloprotease RseP [Aeromicrobium sp.]